MRRTTTILLVGALLATLAIAGLAPAVSAHSGTDTQAPTPDGDAANATEMRAQYMAAWMEQRMGHEGVVAFEEQTGTTIQAVAHAMAEHMGPWAGSWGMPAERGQYGPGGYGMGGYDSSGYGPQTPCGGGYGHGMGGYGHGMGGGR